MVIQLYPSPHQGRNRALFLKELRRRYKGQLVKQPIALELVKEPNAVQHQADFLVLPEQKPERHLGTSIVQVYEDAARQLLILGEPGAGKSALLCELALYQVRRAEQKAQEWLPVIVSLSSWAEKQPLFQDWLVTEIVREYGVPPKLIQSWLQENCLGLLLDGLDQVPQQAREACINAIVKYRENHLVPLVVCSRRAEYEESAKKQLLKLNSAVIVQPLTMQQIEDYLSPADEKLAALRETLRKESELQDFVKTPLVLRLMREVYQEEPVDEQLLIAKSQEERYYQLFKRYVECRVKGRPFRNYSLEKTLYWLQWLAQQMKQRYQETFYLEWMQPDWSQYQGSPPWLKEKQPWYRRILRFIIDIGSGGSSKEDDITPSQRNDDSHRSYLDSFASAIVVASTVGIAGALLWGIFSMLFVVILNSFHSHVSLWVDGKGLSLGGLLNSLRLGGLLAWIIGIFMLSDPIEPTTVLWSWRGYLQQISWQLAGWLRSLLSILLGLTALEGLGWIGTQVGINGWWKEVLVGLSAGLVGFLLPGISIIKPLNTAVGFLLGRLLKNGFFWVFGTFGAVGSVLSEWQIGNWITIVQYAFAGFGVFGGFGLLLGEFVSSIEGGMTCNILKGKDIQKPNQGIWYAAYNSTIIGLSTILLGTALSGLVGYLFTHFITHSNDSLAGGIAVGFILSFISGIYLAMSYGGGTCLSHFSLRLRLCNAGHIPWNYVRFLKCSVSCGLLKKEGGGYKFYHSLLQDYFISQSKHHVHYSIKTADSKEIAVSPPLHQPPNHLESSIGAMLCILGHTTSGIPKFIVWSPDGRYVAYRCSDKEVAVWDIENKRFLSTYHGHSYAMYKSITSIVWANQSSYIASASENGDIHIWNALTGRKKRIYRKHARFICHAIDVISWSPDETSIASTGRDGRIHVWDPITGYQLWQANLYTREVAGLTWLTEDPYLIIEYPEKITQVWNTVTHCQHSLYTSNPEQILVIAHTKDNVQIAFGGKQGEIHIWNIRTDQTFSYLNHTAEITGLSWSPDGTQLVSTSRDGTIQILDIPMQQVVFTDNLGATMVSTLLWVPSRMEQVALSLTRRIQKQLGISRRVEEQCFLGRQNTLAWSPTQKYIASISTEGAIYVWDIVKRDRFVIGTHKGAIVIRWSPEGERLATGSSDTYVIWQVK